MVPNHRSFHFKAGKPKKQQADFHNHSQANSIMVEVLALVGFVTR
ncbi:hypothetical protein [Paenibacillus sp. FSL H7-0331]|nr:hypothetical protein [Paenibacillus sp. FSL H7-0331]